MNQIEIGKFIAAERKKKSYTQRQLADIIGISDKTISKWERGKGFPDVSLLLPLCTELDITVNELLSANRLTGDTYKEKAEENIMKLMKEKQENKVKWNRMVITGINSFAAFFALIIIAETYTDAISTPARVLILVIAFAIFTTGLYVVTQEERTIGYYKCPKCEHYFVPTTKAYIFGPHFGATRKLKCPKCGEKHYCKKVFTKDDVA